MSGKAPALYRVLNITRNVEVSHRTEWAQSFGSRFMGLMGRESLPVGEGLHIVPCNSIHMFFMRFAIDCAFLDKEGQVVKILHAIRPWRVSAIYGKAHSVLELPAGNLAGNGTQQGDRLRFEAI